MDRRERLAKGESVTTADVVEAQEAAAISRQHDVESSSSAAAAHRTAAEVYRRVAAQLEESGDHEGAARHRQGAVNHDEAARSDDLTAIDEASD